MSNLQVPLVGTMPHVVSIALLFAGLYIVQRIGAEIYSVFFGPLSNIPGPKTFAFSRIPWIRLVISGEESSHVPKLHQQYGPVVRIAPDQVSIATGAQGWKELYGFKKGAGQSPYKDPGFYNQTFNKVAHIINADDATHSRQRKVLSHSFSDRALKEQEPLVKKWAEKLRFKLAEQAQAGVKTDMLKMYNCTTFDVMGDLTFAEPLQMLDESEYSPWVKTIFESIKRGTMLRMIARFSSFTRWLILDVLVNSQTLRNKQSQHWDYTRERVDRRLASTPDRPDLWTRIIEKGSEKTGGLSLQEHYSNASILMIAGTETTATALSGITYYLLLNPSYLSKLTAEIRSAFSDFDSVHLEDLSRLKYMHAVIQEGMRMYPPVPIGMQRVSPPGGVTVAGHFLPEGTIVAQHQLSTYRMEEHFKKPYEFHPERWLHDPEFKDDHLDAFEPFSLGPRNCIGKNLAWHEMRVLLVAVLLHFDLELCEESRDWADQKIYTLWEKKPLMCRLVAAKA